MTPVDTTPSEIAVLLVEFGRAPGNFPVRLREPRELYEQIEIIASWALGKVPEGLVEREEALRDAAVLFVQRACFAPGNNHYEVLGLTPGPLNADALRARYRSLIRLTHPDVGVAGLPTTAAGTVNRAYEVLSDDELRHRYDEVLAKREQGANASPGRAAAKRIELRSTWGDRLQSWVARHPLIMRASVAVACLGVVGLVLVAWAAVSSQSSTALIVARSTAADEEASDAVLDKSGRFSLGESTTGVVKMARPLPSQPNADPARIPQLPKQKLAIADAGSAQPSTTSRSPSPTSPAPAEPQTAPSTNTQLRHLGNMFGWGEQRPVGTEIAQTVANTPVVAPRSAPPATGTMATTTPTAPTTSPPGPQLAPAKATSVPAPAAASIPAATQVSAARNNGVGSSSGGFPVDTVRAKSFLTDILMSLEKPSNARSTNAYLSEMNVQGSLLQPALQLMRKYPEINIENMNWQDNVRPGVMRVQGSVIITARNVNLAESRKVAFQLNAEFWGLRDGTFLASLNMKEED